MKRIETGAPTLGVEKLTYSITVRNTQSVMNSARNSTNRRVHFMFHAAVADELLRVWRMDDTASQ
jgi:hypothetical protein